MHFSGSFFRAGVGVMELTGFLGGGFCPNLRLGLGGLLTYFPGLLLISWMVDCISFFHLYRIVEALLDNLGHWYPQDQIQIVPASQTTGRHLQQE